MAGESTSIDFRVDYDHLMANGYLTDEAICEDYFMQSNTYNGAIYQLIQIKHKQEYGIGARSLSTGDRIVINGRVYKCESIGWSFEGVRQVG